MTCPGCNNPMYWHAHMQVPLTHPAPGTNLQEMVMDKQPTLEGKKNDQGKPELGLVPKSLIWAVGTVLTMGAKIYGTHNWRNGLAWSRPYNALLRHLTAWWGGEDLDPESGLSHLWHASAELAFLVEYEESKAGLDDRYKSKTVEQ